MATQTLSVVHFLCFPVLYTPRKNGHLSFHEGTKNSKNFCTNYFNSSEILSIILLKGVTKIYLCPNTFTLVLFSAGQHHHSDVDSTHPASAVSQANRSFPWQSCWVSPGVPLLCSPKSTILHPDGHQGNDPMEILPLLLTHTRHAGC